MKLVLATAITFATIGVACAQQAAPPQPDRKDFIISTIQAQRGAAADAEAVCRADATLVANQFRDAITDRDKQIEELKRKADAAADEATTKFRGMVSDRDAQIQSLQRQIDEMKSSANR